MKSYQYTATDANGEKVTGVIESEHFEDATREIKQRGLELVSLEEAESKIASQMRPFVFEAIDGSGEEVQGTLKGADSESVTEQLKNEYGFEVKKVQELAQHEREEEQLRSEEVKVEQVQKPEEKEEEEDGILFSKRSPIFPTEPKKEERHIQGVEQEIEELLKQKERGITEDTYRRIEHLRGMIDLLIESPDKKRLKNLKRELKRVKKLAEREIEEQREKKWKEYEKKAPGHKVDSYDEFHEEDEVPEPLVKEENKGGIGYWMRVIDYPNEHIEKEVIIKQHYESVWKEVQRFTGALVIFYMTTFFLSYYMKRSGVDDSFLVRIYDTTLFKQIVLALFLLYAALSIRIGFLSRRTKTDIGVLALWIAASLWIFM